MTTKSIMQTVLITSSVASATVTQTSDGPSTVNGSSSSDSETVSTTKLSTVTSTGEYSSTILSYTSPHNGLSLSSQPIVNSTSSTATTDGAIALPDRTGAVAGGVVAAIILLVVMGVIVVIAVCMCRRRRNKEKYYIEENYDIPFNTLYYSE